MEDLDVERDKELASLLLLSAGWWKNEAKLWKRV